MEQKSFKPMLLLTVNQSIGDKKLHFTISNLVELFSKKEKDYTELDKYAIEIIQTEATKEEIYFFIKEFDIDILNVKILLNYKD